MEKKILNAVLEWAVVASGDAADEGNRPLAQALANLVNAITAVMELMRRRE